MATLVDQSSPWAFDHAARVLLVEAEPDEALRASLHSHQFDVKSVPDVRGVLDSIGTWQPEVVLLCAIGNGNDPSVALTKLAGRCGAASLLVYRSEATSDTPLADETVANLLALGADDVIAGRCSAALLVARVRCQVRQAQQRGALLHGAMRHPLTGLFSRGFFLASLRMRVSRLLRQQANQLCLIVIDVDKKTSSPSAREQDPQRNGDEVLKRIASVLDYACREGDMVAHYGHASFVLTLSGASETQGTVVADRLRRTIEDEGMDDLEATVSAGVAAWETQRGADAAGNNDEVDPQAVIEALLRGADAALEDAKRRGPNRVSSNAWTDPAFAALTSSGSSQLN